MLLDVHTYVQLHNSRLQNQEVTAIQRQCRNHLEGLAIPTYAEMDPVSQEMVKEAERSHAALSLEMERAAADGKSEQDFYTTEWGNRPTRQFFAQCTNTERSPVRWD